MQTHGCDVGMVLGGVTHGQELVGDKWPGGAFNSARTLVPQRGTVVLWGLRWSLACRVVAAPKKGPAPWEGGC